MMCMLFSRKGPYPTYAVALVHGLLHAMHLSRKFPHTSRPATDVVSSAFDLQSSGGHNMLGLSSNRKAAVDLHLV